MKTWPILVAGKWKTTKSKLDVIYPYTGKPFARVCLASPEDIEKAIAQSVQAFTNTKRLTCYERSNVLISIVAQLKKQREGFAKIITLESGKPIRDSRTEVDRAITTFTIASEETKRIPGVYLPIDLAQGNAEKRAVIGRFPLGPIAGITPFNFPLNLVAHKIAPALASGNQIGRAHV